MSVDPITASFTAIPGTGISPLTVNFDASASFDVAGTIVHYDWDFGDGTNGSGKTVSHSYAVAGSFITTLTVTDGAGRADTIQRTINDFNAEDLALPVCGDQDGSETPLTFGANCAGYSVTPDAQLYRVNGTGPVSIRFDWIFREASIDNELEVYKVDDLSGQIGSLKPRRCRLRRGRERTCADRIHERLECVLDDVTLAFHGGDILAFFIVQGSLASFEAQNPTDDISARPLAFFSLDAVNPDDADHMVAFAHNDGEHQQFAWEDLPGEGGDFNDIIFNLHASLQPIATLSTAETADVPTTTVGTPDGYTITVTNSGSQDAY